MSPSKLAQRMMAASFMIVLAGCAGSLMKPVTPEYRPVIEVTRAPGQDLSSYRTFSMIPPSMLVNDMPQNDMDAIDYHLAFQARNQLEGRGYRWVRANEKPDFLVTILARPGSKKGLFGAGVESGPRWAPGTDIFQYRNSARSSDLAQLPETLPSWGKMDRSDYVGAAHDPVAGDSVSGPGAQLEVELAIFDRMRLQSVWNSVGTGMSSVSDPRIAGQLIVRLITKNLPVSSFRADNVPAGTFKTGLGFVITTLNGNEYFPMITGLTRNGPAHKYGVQQMDMILSINHADTANKSMYEIGEMLTAGEQSALVLKLWRGGMLRELTIDRQRGT